MADKVITSTGDCSACCGGGTTGCSCALLIPPFGAPYADYATASAVVDPANHRVGDCLAYYEGDSTDLTSFNAVLASSVLTCSGAFGGTSGTFGPVWLSVSALSGAVLVFNFTDGAQQTAWIYKCDGTLVEVVGPSSSLNVSSPLPDDGEYYIKIIVTSGPPPSGHPFSSCSIIFSVLRGGSFDPFTLNPVIAKYATLGPGGLLQCRAPQCEMECISSTTFENCPQFDNEGTSCESRYQSNTPCGAVQQTAQVRLILTNLIPGVAYQATVDVGCEDCFGPGGGGYVLSWCFIAESDTETTDYQGISIIIMDGCNCVAETCSISQVCGCA